MSTTIIFGTGNMNKLEEIQGMLSKEGDINIVGLTELGHHKELEETGQTLQENALQKVNFIYKKFGAPAFAEDTGLEVDALSGAPGVYSARYGGPEKDASQNMSRLLNELKNKSSRKAQFRIIIAFRDHEKTLTFEGLVRGEITISSQGQGGFGYDPIFKPEGFTSTFGELPPEIKKRISHRAKAWKKLQEYLKNRHL